MSRPVLVGRGTAFLVALFCCALWGSAFPTVKAGLAYLTPTFFAGARFTIAGLAVLALARARGISPPRTWAGWKPVLVIGFFQTVLGYAFFFHGLKTASGISGSIINSSGTLLVVVLAYVILGEGGWTAVQVAGVAVGFAGVVLALLRPDWHPAVTLRGEGLVFLSALSIAGATILVKRIAATMDALLVSGGSMLSGGVVLLGLAAATEPLGRESFTLHSTILLFYSAFISAAAFTLWYALLRYHRVSTISTVKFTIPLIGSLLSAFFLGEELSLAQGFGGAMVGLGIYLVFARPGKGPAAVVEGP